MCSAKFVKPDLTKLTSCGDKAHCYDKAKMDQTMAGALIACKDASQVCVPDEVLNADGGKLKSCKVAVLNGAAGGCIQLDLLPQAKQQGGAALKQDVCDAGQACIPCTDPTNGNAPTPFCEPIGVRDAACSGGDSGGTSSSGGTTPAPAAQQACCTTNGNSNGVCIASSAIPADSQGSTIQDTCTGDNKCVPKAMVQGTPVTCDGGFLGNGVCLDKCFSGSLGFAGDIGILSQDKCGSTELCVPCKLASLQGGSTPIPGCN
jgi:hypothetical protein